MQGLRPWLTSWPYRQLGPTVIIPLAVGLFALQDRRQAMGGASVPRSHCWCRNQARRCNPAGFFFGFGGRGRLLPNPFMDPAAEIPATEAARARCGKRSRWSDVAPCKVKSTAPPLREFNGGWRGRARAAFWGASGPNRNQRSETSQSIGTSRSSHCPARFLICSKLSIAGSPSRTIVVRLRSLGSNVIARNTAARSFIEPWSVRVTTSSGSSAMGPRLHYRLARKPAHAPRMPNSPDNPTWLIAGYPSALSFLNWRVQPKAFLLSTTGGRKKFSLGPTVFVRWSVCDISRAQSRFAYS